MSKSERMRRENIKIRKLRRTVDLTCSLLYQLPLTPELAQNIIGATKKVVLTLFPGCEEEFNLIYLSRFDRILRERGIEEKEPVNI
ncbi:MAG: hypothetical protein V3U24_11115 [Candidatus Neomarinimicrobiota bacterium]